MPKVAHLTGMIVTAIVVFGTDADILTAIPMGIFAGSLAMFFTVLSEGRQAVKACK